jgi:hypothetical protein
LHGEITGMYDLTLDSKTSAGLSLGVLLDDGAFGEQPGQLLHGSFGFSRTLTEHLSLDSGVEVWSPLSGAESRETQWIGSVGFSYNF